MVSRETASGWRSGYLVEVCTGLLMLVLFVAMVASPGEETVPYHLLFVVFTLVYGFRIWPMRPTLLVLAVIGVIMYIRVADGTIAAPEVSEVLILPLLLLAVVWHAQRRAATQRQVEKMAEERECRLQREREFLRDTSHAIRTPATISRGHVELIQGALADPEAHEDSEVVVPQLDRMSAQSERLLALARLDSESPLTLEKVEPPASRWSAASSRSPAARSRASPASCRSFATWLCTSAARSRRCAVC